MRNWEFLMGRVTDLHLFWGSYLAWRFKTFPFHSPAHLWSRQGEGPMGNTSRPSQRTFWEDRKQHLADEKRDLERAGAEARRWRGHVAYWPRGKRLGINSTNGITIFLLSLQAEINNLLEGSAWCTFFFLEFQRSFWTDIQLFLGWERSVAAHSVVLFHHFNQSSKFLKGSRSCNSKHFSLTSSRT